MRDQRQIRLTRHQRPAKPTKKSKAESVSWEGVDRDLFESLRELRRAFAEERGVPPYVIFSDTTLRELARARPSNMAAMRMIYGIGEKKLAEFGEAFMAKIDEASGLGGLARDCAKPDAAQEYSPTRPTSGRPPSADKQQAMLLLRGGMTIEEVARQSGRAASTVCGYLGEIILEDQPATLDTWLDRRVYEQISDAIDRLQATTLKPVFVELGEKIPYDQIRLVMTHKAMSS
jgi:ATP-dependent DNA helicase RecQ